MKTSTSSLPLLLAVGCTLWLTGCDGGASKSGNKSENQTSSAEDEAKAIEQCDSLITNGIDMLQPDHMGISSERTTAIDLLNDWHQRCAAGLGEIDEKEFEPVKGLLTKQAIKDLQNSRFLGRDGEHIRSSLLFHNMVDYIAGKSQTDLGRAADLFEFIVRNVSLVPDNAQLPPLSPFQIFLYGVGTAEDRALVFNSLLSQLQIDAVIIRPKLKAPAEKKPADKKVDKPATKANTPSGSLLVGVLIDEKVYLFDPSLGLPIPSAAEANPQTVTIRVPATWNEVIATPETLKQLNLDEENTYGLTSDALKAAHVELIGNSSLWSARMRDLQGSLSGSRFVVISDSLTDTPEEKGQYSRVLAAGTGKWTKENLSIWKTPEMRLDTAETYTAEQLQKVESFRLPLTVPQKFEIVQDESGKPVPTLALPENIQLKTRISQLQGNYEASIASYLTVRLSDQIPPPESIPKVHQLFFQHLRRMHAIANHDATYYGAICQLESGAPSAAANSLRDFIRKYGNNSPRSLSAQKILAFSLAKSGKLLGAASRLEKITADTPDKLARTYRARRWKQLRENQQQEDVK